MSPENEMAFATLSITHKFVGQIYAQQRGTICVAQRNELCWVACLFPLGSTTMHAYFLGNTKEDAYNQAAEEMQTSESFKSKLPKEF